MAETEFSIVFDGPAITEGRIPVRDLAPALFALGEVFQEASRVLYPPDLGVRLDVTGVSDGSFDVHLVLVSTGHWISHLFTSDEANALDNFKSLVIGPAYVGVFWFIGVARRRKIAKREPVGDGRISVTFEDETTVELPAQTLELYDNVRVRKVTKEVVQPLEADGIDRIEFRERTDEVTVSLDPADVPAFDTSDPADDSELLVDEVSDTAVTVETVPVSHPDALWRLSTASGSAPFSARMEDQTFMDDILSLKEGFHAGDVLIGSLRKRQYRTATGQLRTAAQAASAAQAEAALREMFEPFQVYKADTTSMNACGLVAVDVLAVLSEHWETPVERRLELITARLLAWKGISGQ